MILDNPIDNSLKLPNSNKFYSKLTLILRCTVEPLVVIDLTTDSLPPTPIGIEVNGDRNNPTIIGGNEETLDEGDDGSLDDSTSNDDPADSNYVPSSDSVESSDEDEWHSFFYSIKCHQIGDSSFSTY